MSNLKIYGIYDSAAGAFIQFVPFQNDRLAEMSFTKFFKEHNINLPLIYDYPSNFEVYYIADYDDVTGEFTNVSHQLLLRFDSIIDKS